VKLLRLILMGAAAAAAALAACLALALLPAVQTWAARMAIASRPALHGSLGALSAGWGRVQVTALHLELGGAVLTVPSLQAELPVVADGWDRQIAIRRLVAKGWTLDLTHVGPPPAAAAPLVRARRTSGGLVPSAYSAEGVDPAVVDHAFRGIFNRLILPCDVSLGSAELEGDVLLPGPPGQPPVLAHVVIGGGGLGAGRQAAFPIRASVNPENARAPFGVLGLAGALAAEMDTPRTFNRLAFQAELTARGGQIPDGIRLQVDLAAARGVGEETYALALARGSQQLAALLGNLPESTRGLAGTWKLDLRDSDVAPFAMGRALPSFTVTGEGAFDADATWNRVHARGHVRVAADRLGALRPQLAGFGAVAMTAQFDLAERGDSLRIDTGVVGLAGAHPIASLRVLQAFEYNWRTGDLKVADSAGDLVGISAQGVPLVWLNPFLPQLTLSGGDARGEWVLRAADGGLTLRSTDPLVASGVGLARAGRPLVQNLDVSILAIANYAPQGWQVQVAPLTVGTGGQRLLTVEARAGRLAGVDQPVKLAGTWSCELERLRDQPAATTWPQLTGGRAAGDVSASLGASRELEATLQVAGLAGLPAVDLRCRADVAADGTVAFNAPLRVEINQRATDIDVAGNWRSTPTGPRVELQVTGERIAVDDLEILAAPFALGGAGAGAGTPPPTASRVSPPPWAGLSGRLAFAVRELAFANLEFSDVGGTFQFADGDLRLMGGRLIWGDSCQVKVEGDVAFDPGAERTYALQAAVSATDFEAGTWLRYEYPGESPFIDGRFNITSTLTSHGRDPADLLGRLQGEFHLSSKGGRFSALQASVADSIRQAPSRLAGALDTVSSLFGKKPEGVDAAGKSLDKAGQSIVEFTNLVSDIHYDQIDVSAIRGSDLTVHLVELSMIAPEERLTGSGQISYDAGLPLLAQPLSLDLQLGARGKVADLLGSVGLLKDEKDDLGYTRMAQAIHLGGTLSQIDQNQWRDLLIQAALRKATSGLFDRLLGK